MTKKEENEVRKKRYMAEYGECFVLKRLDGSEEVLNPGYVKHTKEPDFICDLSEFHDLGTKSAFEKLKKEMEAGVILDPPSYKVFIDPEKEKAWEKTVVKLNLRPTPLEHAKTELIKQQAESIRTKNEKERMSQTIPPSVENLDYQTPNCETCIWKRTLWADQGNEINIKVGICQPQGDRSVEKCYNNDNCRALFEVKEEKQIFTVATQEKIKEILSWPDSKEVIYELSKLPPFQQVDLKGHIIYHLNEFIKTASMEELEPLNYKKGVSPGLHLSAEILVVLSFFGKNHKTKP